MFTRVLTPTRDWIGSSVCSHRSAGEVMSSPWGEETGEGGRESNTVAGDGAINLFRRRGNTDAMDEVGGHVKVVFDNVASKE